MCYNQVNSKAVLLEKIGWVKIKPNQIPTSPCKYTNPRISYDGMYWYLSVGIDQEQPQVELTGESIGIDIGIKDLAICSNGMAFKNINKIRVVKQLEKRLRRLQRKVSNKYQQNKKGKEYVKTSNIIKLERQIKLLHRRLANIRTNHLHQSTNKIVKAKPSKIVMETLNIKGMMKTKHNVCMSLKGKYNINVNGMGLSLLKLINGLLHLKFVVSVEIRNKNFHYLREFTSVIVVV